MRTHASQLTLVRLCLAAAALLVALPMRGDSITTVLDLCRNAPGLDFGFGRHLVFDDSLTFRRFCDDVGQTAIREAYVRIDERLWTAPRDSYMTRAEFLGPYLERLGIELATLYGSPECLRLLTYRRALGARVLDLNRSVEKHRRLSADGTRALEDRVEAYRRIKVEFEGLGYEHGLVAVDGQLARALFQSRNDQEGNALLRTALARARQQGDEVMICQYLGEMGFQAGGAGQVDSMLAFYREGIAIADRHRMPEQAVRLRRSLANYYVHEGKLAVAMHLFREAQSRCRRWGGGPLELDVVLGAMERFADLGCWDIVREFSQRLPVLLRGLERSAYRQAYPVKSVTARRLDARLLAAEGKLDEALALQSDLGRGSMRILGPDIYAPLVVEHAEALRSSGRPREALDRVTRGHAYADSFGVIRVVYPLTLIRARAALAIGELAIADSALHQLRADLDGSSPGVGFARSDCDALDLGLALARGQGRTARRTLDRSLRDLRATVGRLDAAPHAYLELARAEDLREMAHRCLADDAADSYRFELDWRSLPGRMGRGAPPGAGHNDAHASLLKRGGIPTIHLVYGFTDERLTRWTLASGFVRREWLPVSRSECDRRVDLAMRLLSRDPGPSNDRLPDSLRAACADLGRLLLPHEVRDASRMRIIVSAEGSLARLPFEALDTGQGHDYAPLLDRHDVVYARPVPPLRRRDGDGTSVVLLEGDPGAGEATVAASLAAAQREASAASRILPNPRVVFSGGISKRTLLDAWSRASIIYVAAHLVRDREAPVLCHFPMRFGARPHHIEDAYLDLHDARTQDLSGCDLAVLSSCASGEPYVVGGRTGPSMADALLDAGANAVIHTRWQVRDDRAAVMAPRLAQAWLGSKVDPIGAWCAERRAMIRSPHGCRHPFEWAAWSVTVRLPVPPMRLVDSGFMAEGDQPALSVRAWPARSPEPHGSPR